MGCVWRSAMPLLSTLAALVIIVHSDEEFEREHPYDLRARSLDVRTPNYDQPWRAMDVEPMTYQTTPGEEWHDHNSHEEPPKRRRLGRKRKRRPMSNEDLQPQERTITHPEDNLPYYEPDYNPAETTEAMPRRRKKQKRRNNWTEENAEQERPLRRRGMRRKRPSRDWPVNEFKEFRSEENPPEKPRTEQNDPPVEENNDNEYEDRYRSEQKDPQTDFAEPPQSPASAEENTNVQIKEDKSLSDFSMEVYSPDVNERFKEEEIPQSTIEDSKTSTLVASLKRNGPVDPMKLKELLKRSHGASLSEILQKHNLTLADLLQGRENLMKHPSLKKPNIIDNKQKPILLNHIKHNNEQQFDAENRFQDKTANLIQSESRQEDKTTNLVNVAKDITTDSVKTKIELSSRTTTDVEATNKENITSVETTVTIADTTSVKLPNTQDFQSLNSTNITTIENIQAEESIEQRQETLEVKENAPKIATKRRYPGMLRRKLRMRPGMNNTQYKGQLNRDLIALTAKRYLRQNSRNVPKSKEWKDALPAMLNTSKVNSENLNSSESSLAPATTASVVTEETAVETTEYSYPTTVVEETTADEKNTTEDNEDQEIYNNSEDTETTQMPTTTMQATFETTTTERVTTTERITTRVTRPTVNRMGLRRQAFNNRLKRKRMKLKNSTTEAPEQDSFMKDLFGIPNLVSSSEFIAKTQIPNQTPKSKSESADFTALDDFMTTTENGKDAEVAMSTKDLQNISSTTSLVRPVTSTTEESAKFEIEEILNDTRASARLSRILMERNMTLTELVEHRERGSSHVHLADIFHNASKEPKPPEPFLSKSLIEPISKETYPLRALLEANLHDPTGKMTTLDSTQIQPGNVNIPVVMDFGNNVNENGETIGIISLFNKYTGSDVGSEKSTVNKDSEGTPYITTVVTVDTNTGDNTREGRVLKDDVDSMKQDIVNWNELFAIIRRNNKNESEETAITKGLTPPATHVTKKVVLEEDTDGDGLIVLEDLQHLKDFDNNIASASDEKLEVNTHESIPSNEPGIASNAHSHTKSVTVATASIIGLSLILFLLTYAAFKWNQQRRMLSKKQSFCEERIPTPVFENRKGHKNNCSTRSISPMLTNSNIYTMTTLESQNGKESPEYAWDSLRKPFQ